MKILLLFFSFLFSTLVFSQSKALKETVHKVYLLEKSENYAAAKEHFLAFEKKNKISPTEKEFVKTYLLFYDFLIAEDIKKLDAALKLAQKWKHRNPCQTELLLNLYTAKYHDIASNVGWGESLELALKGAQILDFKDAKLETKTDYLYDLGYLYGKTGNNFEGIKFYKKSLALYIKQFGETDKEVALNYNNMAYSYSHVYNSKSTIKYYLKAAKIWEQIHQNTPDEKDYLIAVYQNLISEYLDYGDLEKAKWAQSKLNYYYFKKYDALEGKNLETYFPAKLSYVLANIRVYLKQDQLATSEKLINTLLEDKKFSYTNKSHLEYLLQCYQEIMTYALEKEDYNEIIIFGNKSNALMQKYHYNNFLMSTNMLLAMAYQNLKMPEKGLFHIEKAIDNTVINYFTFNKYSSQFIKANILNDLNHNDQAIKVVKNNIESLVLDLTKQKKDISTIKVKDVSELISTEFIKLFYRSGEMYLNQYEKSKNKNDFNIAFNLYKISANLFTAYYLKGEYNETLNTYQNGINEGLLKIALKKKLSHAEKSDLINTIEQNASQHLIKTYQNKISFNSNKNNKYVSELKDLNTELNFYKAQKETNSKTIQFNQKQIKSIENKIERIAQKTSATEQNISKITASNFNLNEVLKTINLNEIIVKYYVAQDNVYCLLLEKDKIELQKIGAKNELQKLVTDFMDSQKIITADYKKNCSSLQVLIPKNISQKKVIFIPDNFLNYLPFETIYNTKKSQYFIEDHFVSYEYSLPMWLLHQQHLDTKNSYNLAAFSPFYPKSAIGNKRNDFKDLKFASIESQKIVALFDGDLFAKEKATKANFIKEKEHYDIFHLSMHSQVYEDDFNKSCLVFSNNEKLYFSDLYGMNMPISMVVLSACDTGNGTIKNGEGIMSMSRALTYAGVKSAVVSLWQVSDKETAEIMVSFYENLKKGQTKDEALANAKTIFINNNPMKNHPYYWAGFIVNGDVSAIAGKSYDWVIYASIALVFVLGFVFRKKLFQLRKQF